MSRRRKRNTHRERTTATPTSTPFAASAARKQAAGAEIGEVNVRITCTDYCRDQFQIHEVKDLVEFLAMHRPEWSKIRWINVEGFGQPEVLRALAEKYQLHPLAVDDVFHTVQRPKAEDYPGVGDLPGRLFVVARAVTPYGERIGTEQVSFFLGRTTLLTFQEVPGDVFETIRPRIETRGSRLRETDVSFLFYSLVDLVVDSYFPVLENLSERLDQLEEDVLTDPSEAVYHPVHDVKRELLTLRRAAWPMRDLISDLLREKHECLTLTTRTYFRDVYDHCAQILDLIETYREITASITEFHMSATSNRLNAAMKVLTTISTIFIPLSFLAGVYGMNMPIPESQWPGMYYAFWGICVSIACGMMWWLRRQNWL